MKKFVIICDSFKGCLSSDDVEKSIEEGILQEYPSAKVCCIPMADGGEGMLDVMMRLSGGKTVKVNSHDALMRPIQTQYGVLNDGVTAVIEMAKASGLPLLQKQEQDPMITTSFGTGEIIHHALSEGYQKLIIGIGGSATNDGGMGMLQALGVKFFDTKGNLLETGCGKLLSAVNAIDCTEFRKLTHNVSVTVACDVDNRLCGPNGATFVFAPQKGATTEQVLILDQGMYSYAQRVKQATGWNIEELPGAGAAGGMGGALAAFFHASLIPGTELLLDTADFKNKIHGASFIITGEGKADKQTLMGKVSSGVLKAGRKAGIPVVLLAGSVTDVEELNLAGFSAVLSITPRPMSLEDAMNPSETKQNLKNTTIQLTRLLHHFAK